MNIGNSDKQTVLDFDAATHMGSVEHTGATGNRLVKPLDAAFDAVQGDWRTVTEPFAQSSTGRQLIDFVDYEVASGQTVYPAEPLRALALTPLATVRVVILGQDPYHGPAQAEGLAFSVSDGVKLPPSLRNMFKELKRDLALEVPKNGSLVRWARQGVLLLNTTLTVRDGQAASHAKKGWETLTDGIIELVAQQPHPIVFLLWGAHAQAKAPLIEATRSPTAPMHLILKANHPSPLSATKPPVPFIGCGHFSVANAFLTRDGNSPISW